MNAIETRLDAVENQLRFQRRIINLLILLLVAGIFYGATAPIPSVIRARKFEVVNKEGREVVVMESWRLGGIIETYPAKGKYWPSVTLGHSDRGDGQVLVRNKAGKKLFNAGGDNENGDGFLVLRKKTGEYLLYAGEGISGNGFLSVFGKAGKPLIFAGGDRAGNGILKVEANQGKGEISLQAQMPRGGPGVLIVNKTGEEVVQLLTDKNGMGFVGAFNRQGRGSVLRPR